MKRYVPVPFSSKLPYPILAQLEAYTEHYRLNFMDRFNPDKGYHNYTHSELLEVLVIGGVNDFFLVYCYPPAGFEISNPDDILNLELWQGWIFEYLFNEKVYRVDTSTREHGIPAFLSRKRELGY